MRDFFIQSFEKLVAVIVILMVIGVVVAGISTMFAPDGGFFFGLFVLIAGGLYTIAVGGMLYLVLGIYNNTKRTADATEKMAGK